MIQHPDWPPTNTRSRDASASRFNHTPLQDRPAAPYMTGVQPASLPTVNSALDPAYGQSLRSTSRLAGEGSRAIGALPFGQPVRARHPSAPKGVPVKTDRETSYESSPPSKARYSPTSSDSGNYSSSRLNQSNAQEWEEKVRSLEEETQRLQWEEKIQSLEEENQRLQSNAQEREEKIQSLEEENQRLQSNAQQQEEKIQSLEKENQRLQSNAQQREEKIQSLEEENQRLQEAELASKPVVEGLSCLLEKHNTRYMDDEQLSELEVFLFRTASKVQEIRNELRAEQDLCCICFVRKKTVVFLPCSHQCTCGECSDVLLTTRNKCPICNGDITQRVVPFK